MPAILALLARLVPFLVRAIPFLAIAIKTLGILHMIKTGWVKFKYVFGLLIFLAISAIAAIFYIFVG